MKVIVSDDYELMSTQAANAIAEIVKPSAYPLVCVASGDSPKGLYKEWKTQHANNKISIHSWNFLGLDEWLGLDADDEGSCRFMLNRDLFFPLNIQQEKICCFDGVTKNTDAECERIEAYIQQNNGINVMILGLGMNGHIGLNEPGTSPTLHSHVSEIHSTTKQVGQKYFSQPQQLTKGITLGIATIMKAQHVFLIVSGEKKASILKEAIEGEISENVPASFLRNHSSCIVFADKEAASLLTHQ